MRKSSKDRQGSFATRHSGILIGAIVVTGLFFPLFSLFAPFWPILLLPYIIALLFAGIIGKFVQKLLNLKSATKSSQQGLEGAPEMWQFEELEQRRLRYNKAKIKMLLLSAVALIAFLAIEIVVFSSAGISIFIVLIGALLYYNQKVMPIKAEMNTDYKYTAVKSWIENYFELEHYGASEYIQVGKSAVLSSRYRMVGVHGGDLIVARRGDIPFSVSNINMTADGALNSQTGAQTKITSFAGSVIEFKRPGPPLGYPLLICERDKGVGRILEVFKSNDNKYLSGNEQFDNLFETMTDDPALANAVLTESNVLRMLDIKSIIGETVEILYEGDSLYIITPDLYINSFWIDSEGEANIAQQHNEIVGNIENLATIVEIAAGLIL